MKINEQELAKVREQLRLALEKKGEDYVYEYPLVPELDDYEIPTGDMTEAGECLYLVPVAEGTPSEPSCLWGHVLLGLGVGPEELVEYEGQRIDTLPVQAWTDQIITAAARSSQQEQDRAGTWGQAVARFEERIEEMQS